MRTAPCREAGAEQPPPRPAESWRTEGAARPAFPAHAPGLSAPPSRGGAGAGPRPGTGMPGAGAWKARLRPSSFGLAPRERSLPCGRRERGEPTGRSAARWAPNPLCSGVEGSDLRSPKFGKSGGKVREKIKNKINEIEGTLETRGRAGPLQAVVLPAGPGPGGTRASAAAPTAAPRGGRAAGRPPSRLGRPRASPPRFSPSPLRSGQPWSPALVQQVKPPRRRPLPDGLRGPRARCGAAGRAGRVAGSCRTEKRRQNPVTTATKKRPSRIRRRR